MTLYSTGMRRSELVRLRVEDINRKLIVHIRQGKGGKDRDVPVPQIARNAARVLEVAKA